MKRNVITQTLVSVTGLLVVVVGALATRLLDDIQETQTRFDERLSSETEKIREEIKKEIEINRTSHKELVSLIVRSQVEIENLKARACKL